MPHEVKLGTIITGDAQRDAVHIAVSPTIAKERLSPGQHCGIGGTTKEPVGIVDPFLKSGVIPGELFWLFLYPGTITSLRHDWTHPAFGEASKSITSEAWLRKYVSNKEYSYEELMEAAKLHLLSGEYFCIGTDDDQTPDDFWVHYAAVTGKIGSGNFFSCAC